MAKQYTIYCSELTNAEYEALAKQIKRFAFLVAENYREKYLEYVDRSPAVGNNNFTAD